MLHLLIFFPVYVLSIPEDYHVVGQGGYQEYMSDWNSDAAWGTGGRLNQPKCIDIPRNMSLCRDIGYTQMRLPNLLDHDTLQEVTSQAGQWVPLLGLHCHPDSKLFLCSLFSPVCLDRPIWPCRTLCEAVKSGCESRMVKYGFPWPDMLRCDKFPEDNDLCINKQSEGEAGRPVDDNICSACSHPQTFEAIVDSFCSSDFALRIRVRDNVIVGNDMKITPMKKKKKYKDNNLTKKDLRNLVLYVENAAGCDCPVLTSTGKKDKLIVMGNKKGNRIIVTHMVSFDENAKETRRAVKAIQKSKDICKGGIKAIVDYGDKGNNDDKERDRKNKKDNGIKKRKKNGNSDTKEDDNRRGRSRNNGNKRKKNDRNGRKDKNGDSSRNSRDNRNDRRRTRVNNDS